MGKQDTLMKALSRSLSGGALKALGVEGVELTAPLPTELPANTLHADMVWSTQDGLVFHLEFQSTRENDLHRFLAYDVRLAWHHQKSVRTVVLYHRAVTHAPDVLDIGTAVYRIENVFLSQLDGDAALDRVTRHLRHGDWQAEDRLRLALAVNMRLHDPVQAFERLLTLVPQVPDEGERELVVAALLTVGEKGLADTQRDRLRKELRQVSKIAQELYEEGREEGEAKKAVAIARAMLARGLDIGLTAEVTGLSRDAVERLRGQAPN